MEQATGQGERLGNLTIQGRGKAGGGVFHNVSIEGIATIDGHIECEKYSVSGVCKSSGGIAANKIHIQGKSEIGGRTEAANCRLEGQVKIHGDCTCETFVANGAFSVDGLLNCDTAKIYLYGPSRVKELGASSVRVQAKPKIFGLHKMVKFHADTIEADDVLLENTVAKCVRGHRVHIGQGCEIGEVEYRETFEQHASAVVREERKI